MSSVVIAGNTSGTVTLAAPDVAGTTTLTLPATSGTVLTSATPFSNGQGPAFSAVPSGSQSLTGGVNTKFNYATEQWDTASCYDTSNSRFTPNVAGYYQITGKIRSNGLCNQAVSIYKNGSVLYTGVGGDNDMFGTIVTGLVYLNGSTDYVEIYGYFSSSLSTTTATADLYFQGFLARAA